MRGVDGICSSALPGRFTERQEVKLRPGEGKTVTWPIVPMEVSILILLVKIKILAIITQ